MALVHLYRLFTHFQVIVGTHSISEAASIVAFIVTRAAVKNINVGVLQSQMQLADLRNVPAVTLAQFLTAGPLA